MVTGPLFGSKSPSGVMALSLATAGREYCSFGLEGICTIALCALRERRGVLLRPGLYDAVEACDERTGEEVCGCGTV